MLSESYQSILLYRRSTKRPPIANMKRKEMADESGTDVAKKPRLELTPLASAVR